MATSLPYQKELDGVRALAVVLVLFFHAKVPGFQGGFIGVDVFFVLSGYLITKILLGAPPLAVFYQRRLRRLLPPLLLLIGAYIIASRILLPDHSYWRDYSPGHARIGQSLTAKSETRTGWTQVAAVPVAVFLHSLYDSSH